MSPYSLDDHWWAWGWTPFPLPTEFGDNPVVDWLRVIACLLAFLLLAVSGRVVLEQRRRQIPMPPGQIARFMALGVAAVSLSLTEVAVMGAPMGPRLVSTLLVDVLGLWGTNRIRIRQRTERIVR